MIFFLFKHNWTQISLFFGVHHWRSWAFVVLQLFLYERAGPMHQTEEVHDIRDAGPLRTMTWWPGFSRWTAVSRVATCTVVFCILLSEVRRKTETTDLMALTFPKRLRALIHRRTAWLLRPLHGSEPEIAAPVLFTKPSPRATVRLKMPTQECLSAPVQFAHVLN